MTTTRRPGSEHETTQTTTFEYDALGRRIAKTDAFGRTEFIWEGLRLIEERRGSSVVSYVYEPGSYVPLARIDATGTLTEQGGLGTADDAPLPANEAEHGIEVADAQCESASESERANACEAEPSSNVYYFHTDQVGLPEELTDAQGHIRWRAAYQAWGNTLAERWETIDLKGEAVAFAEEAPQPAIEQNLRYQGQYLDRDTGLHYNTFRYYDPDLGRFISPDPIGLGGGTNLYEYAPNPASWIDPWGWNKNSNTAVGDWVLYEVRDENGKLAKIGIGKAEDVMATGGNRRALTSARKVAKDPNFPGAEAKVLETHKGITKGEMKEIEAAKVRELRAQGHELPHNRENDRRYKKPGGGKAC